MVGAGQAHRAVAKQDNRTVRVLFQLQAQGPDHLHIARFALPNVPKTMPN